MPHPIILADAMVNVAQGPRIGLRGERIERGTGSTARARYPFPVETVVAASGAAASTATVLQEVSRGSVANISAITAANPGVVTATAHGFATGNKVSLSEIAGMVELNGQTVTVTRVDADSFSIGVDTSAYTAYSSGGIAFGPWVTWATLTFVIPTSGAPVALKRVGKLDSLYDYMRVRITAISGCTIDGYVKRMD
jgi:hypothetical protein